MKKLVLVVSLAACFAAPIADAANAADRCAPSGGFSKDVQDELNAQAKVLEDLRQKAVEQETPASKKISAPNVDIKALSCVDKYSKFKVIVAYPWPTVDMLFDALKNMACRVVDEKVNEMTSGLGMNQNLPYGLGNAGIGVGQGGSGSGPQAGSGIETRRQNQEMGGRVVDGIFR